MKNTLFISIFSAIALIATLFSFSASAQTTPTVSTGSVILQSSRSGFMYGTVNPNGSVTYVRAEIGTTASFGRVYGPQYVGNGTSSADVQFGFINLQENTTYYYRIVAQAGNSVITGETKTFFTNINGGGSTTNTNNNNNNSSNSGQTPNYNYSSNSGSAGAPMAPSVATNGPASVTSTSAVINGSVNPNNVSTSFWFDFGTSPSLGLKTSVQPTGVGNTWQLVTGNLSGLIPGATYYYRVAAQNSQGTNWGEIKTFVATNSTGNSTGGGQVLGSSSGSGTNSSSGSGVKPASSVKPVTAVSNPAKDRPSFVSLEYSLGNEGALVLVADNLKPKPGEEFSYTIVYKNETNSSFNEANLKVILPVQVDYIGSDKSPNNISANIVEFNLDRIPPQSQGIVVVIVKVKETTEPGTNMIFTSVLGYKDSKGVQLANTSYMTVRVGDPGTPLSTASIGLFFGSTTVLWLIAIVLVILMGFLIFRLLKMKEKDNFPKEDDIFGLGKVPATFQPVSDGSFPKR